MAEVNQVTGAEQVVKNLKDRNRRIGLGVSRGLRKGGLVLQRQAMLLVPVDFGNLKASFDTRATGQSFSTVVKVMNTASYAIFVHEHPNGLEPDRFGRPREEGKPQRGNFWDPANRGQSKFLEQPFRAFGPTLVRIVKAEAMKA